ncbi:hypothetical protein [Halorhabdus rudnickae]|uniref:hypothetical protein n=1 Tax=Halorhabdus rudnickae TaxID=1775544 RepID=UPI001AF000BB|nr:hypothetical protein [Halorhabdus rudnickae]
MNQKLIAVAVVALLVVSTAAPALAAEDGLAVSVTQAGNDADVTINVTDNGTAAPNASVDVSVLGVLEDSDSNESDEETGTVTIGGTYETDANGTVTLSAPSEDVRVSVTATVDNRTASTTTIFESDGGDEVFGQQVQAFAHRLLASSDNGIGPSVSEFVTENNPGANNRPDHAGPPADAGPDENVTDGGENETVDDENERGPPEHAGPDGNETDDDDRGPFQAGDRDTDRVRDQDEDPDQDTDRDRTQVRDPDQDTDRDLNENPGSTDEEPDRDRKHDEPDGDDDDNEGVERGPPDHAGPGDDDTNGDDVEQANDEADEASEADDGSDDETDDGEEADDGVSEADDEADDETDADGERGPLDHAGPPN